MNGDFTVSRVNKNVVLFPLIKLRKRNLSKKKKKCSIVAGSGVTWDKSSPEPKKKKKTNPPPPPPPPKILMFWEMELSGSNIKKIPYVLPKEGFSYIFSKESISCVSKNGTLHLLFQTQKL